MPDPNLTSTPAPFTIDWPALLSVLMPIFGDAPMYLVGGAVRDALLHRPFHDLDFATPDDGRKWARKVANALGGNYYPLDGERGVGRALVEYQGESFVVDIARYRGETLREDVFGRDYTINALAVPLEGDCQQIIDLVGGLDDIRTKRLRQCSPDSIRSDPVRALRGIRQSVAFGFLIEAQTRQAIRENAPRIAQSSVERVRDEFLNILSGRRPHAALRAMDVLGLLAPIVPEIEAMKGVLQSTPHIFDVWEHTLQVIERLDGVLMTISQRRTDETAADSAYGMIVYFLDIYRKALQSHLAEPLPNGRNAVGLLMLAALLHDCGKPATHSVGADGRVHFYNHENVGADLAMLRAEALRLSNDEVKRCSEIVRQHMRPMVMHLNLSAAKPPEPSEPRPEIGLSRRQLYRFWRATNVYGLDVCLLTLADYLGAVGAHLNVPNWLEHIQIVGAILDAYVNHRDDVVAPPPLLTGRDLMRVLNLPPGPEIGRLLAELGEAQAAGEIATPEEALALVARLHQEGAPHKSANGNSPTT